MFKKLALILMSVTALAVTGVQAGGHSKDRDKTVIFDVDGGKIAQPYNFNYLVPGTNRNQGIHQAVWEPLFILNYESGKIDSWLGDSFVANANADVWTLNLKKGIKWHDGQDLDADDVVFTIQMLMNDQTGTLNYAAAMQQWIKEVKKQDKHTVVFTLTEPNPRFQLDYFSVKIWGGVVIMPEHVWQGQDPYTFKFYDKEKGWPLGSGAYKLVSASETEFIYDRDDNWWGASQGMSLPAPERLIWAVTSTEENRSMLAARGELDSVMDVTLGAFEAMQARNQNMQAWFDDLPYSWLDPCARQLSINTQVEPWNDPAMRWALNYIIDREEIVRVAYEGTTIPSMTLFVHYGGLYPYIDAVVAAGMGMPLNASPHIAHKIIESKGWKKGSDGFYQKDGKTLEFVIKTHEGYIEKRRIADVVVEQFLDAGIKAEHRPIAGATWTDNRVNGDFMGSMDWHSCGSINEPYASLNRFTDKYMRPIGTPSPGENNYVRWDTAKSKQFSEIVDKMGAMPLNAPGMVDMVVDAYKLWYEELPFIPITQARKLIPFDTTYWTGWPTATNNYNHPATWWQSTHQIIHNLKPAR